MNILQIASLLIVLAAVFGVINYFLLRLPQAIGIMVVALIASMTALGIDALVPGFQLAESARAVVLDIDFSDALLEGMLGLLLFAGALHVKLEELREMWKEKGTFAIDIGIGLNSGFAVVGNMGSSHRMDYTIMGDTVNLGSRLEGITKQYGVKMCISEYTYERTKDKIYARELDLVKVKGKNEPVRIYELMGLVNEDDIEGLKRGKPGAPQS